MSNIIEEVSVGNPAAKLGSLLRELREEKDWTQQQLSRKAEGVLDYSTISKIELGNSDPRVNNLEKLFNSLGFTMEISIVEIPDHKKLRRIKV